VEPVPAPKKVWVYDGHIARYPTAFTSGSVHGTQDCTDCHAGTDSLNSRATAHVGSWNGVPAASSCAGCHNAIITSTASGLHTTLAGYTAILTDRGFNPSDPTSAERFAEQCTKCHVASEDTTPQSTCGHCHVSVPTIAGGGLVAGHAFQETPSMDKNCTACHGSRVKDEYYGLNNALLTANKQYLTTGSPWADPAFTLVADVHKTGTADYDCVDCHSMAEMHGTGSPLAGDRYAVTSGPTCDGCHTTVVGSNSMHTAGHVAAMDCQVCHAQPYKNCFECHTDVSAEDVPFYSISDSAPSADHAHLITFRAGRNPKYTGSGRQKEFSVLRHVPVDGDVFTYSGANAQTGLIPTLTALPTWKHATPHNIIRNTVITQSCANCHGANYSLFWLTNPVTNAEGWVSTANESFETTANSGVTISNPFSYLILGN